jgi:leader peptidase (prepilin peptidase) / N-methyltransferase
VATVVDRQYPSAMGELALWPFAAVFGALIGSFLNVVVWRVPRGESLVRPASHCPNCGHAIRGYDNVPLLSWLVLRGRCRDCRVPISVRYPLVELTTLVAFALVAVWWTDAAANRSVTSELLALLALLYLAAISIALALIDIDVHRLPNAIVLPAYVVCILLLGAASIVDNDLVAIVRGVIGGAALFAFYFVLATVVRGGMGFGDVKLAGVLGFVAGWLGWGELAVAALAPFLLGGIFGLALVAARRVGRKSRIPFGPWMLAGAWVGLVAGGALGAWYVGWFGLSGAA